MKAAMRKHNNDLLIASETKEAVKGLHEYARMGLASEAAYAHKFTGLSLDYCVRMVMHRAARRVAA
jgi:hypothetical protein